MSASSIRLLQYVLSPAVLPLPPVKGKEVYPIYIRWELLVNPVPRPDRTPAAFRGLCPKAVAPISTVLSANEECAKRIQM
jgi:hypothetical protein